MPGASKGSPAGKGRSVGAAASSGHASNAALHDDEDIMSRRKRIFGDWLKKRHKPIPPDHNHMIDYTNSPSPPINRSK